MTFKKDFAAAAAKLLQLCLTLCDPIDGSPPGSPVPGILQARALEWVAISSSNAWKWKVKGKSLSQVRLLATPWTAAHQAPPSMGFSRQEYWSGVPLPSPMNTFPITIESSLWITPRGWPIMQGYILHFVEIKLCIPFFSLFLCWMMILYMLTNIVFSEAMWDVTILMRNFGVLIYVSVFLTSYSLAAFYSAKTGNFFHFSPLIIPFPGTFIG